MRNSKIFRNSILIRVLLVITAFLVMIISSAVVMYYTLNQKLLQNAEMIMDDTQLLFSGILNQPETVLELIATNIEGMYDRGAGLDAIKAYIDEASSPEFKSRIMTDYHSVYAYFDEAGVFHHGQGWIPGEDYRPTERPWYTQAQESDTIVISEPYTDVTTSRYVISYTRRMLNAAGGSIGVVVIDVFLDDFRDTVINKQITPNSYGYMIDKDYRVIMHRDTVREGEYFWESSSATGPFKDIIINGDDISFKRSSNYLGVQSVVFGRQIYNGWYFVLIIPEREYYAELYSMIATTGILGAVLALVLTFMMVSLEKAWRRADEERTSKTIQLAEMEKAREADRRIRLMLDSAPLCVIFWDDELNVVDCNLEGVKLFDLADKQELRERWYDLSPEFQPDGRKSSDAIDEIVAETREKTYIRFEWMHCKLDGEEIPCEVTLISVMYEETTSLLGYIRDLRELKAVMNDLREALNEAKIANQSKSSFLAQMSHEIRTPMNSIIGVTEILLEEDLPPGMAESLGIISNSGNLLLGIINDILDLSKIEAGKMDLNLDSYYIAGIINDSAGLNMMRIGSKDIEFKLNVPDDLPAQMTGDELRIKQILNNILSNAFKYTDKGTVTLSVTHEPCEEANKVILVFEVKDTGCGMTKQQVDTLFSEYTRYNKDKNRNIEGTGLGLSITLRLVNLMNGEIKVESEPGVGSVFTIRIPQELAGDETIGYETAGNLRNFKLKYTENGGKARILRDRMPYGHVLVVDDVDTNLFVAKGLMRPYELEIDTAMSGFEALDKVKDGGVYDIIFMDHMMPEMDGIETVKKLREAGYTEPVIALTANAVTGQSDIFIENGFDGFIAKPIDLRQLNAVLNKYVRDKQPPEVIEKYRNSAGGVTGTAGTAGATTGAADGENNGGNGAGAGNAAGKQRLLQINIDGLNIRKGIDKFNDDTEIYLKILRSYCAGVRSKEDTLRLGAGGGIDSYRIAVHSIKGMSLDLLADNVGYKAAALEDAAKSGDIAYIEENNAAFLDELLALATDIETLILSDAGTGSKPVKDRPDAAVLAKLADACSMYHLDGANAAMSELSKFSYSNDGGLAGWLQSQLDIMDFGAIAGRLAEYATPEEEEE